MPKMWQQIAPARNLVFGGSTTVHSAVNTATAVITLRPNSVEASTAAATPGS